MPLDLPNAVHDDVESIFDGTAGKTSGADVEDRTLDRPQRLLDLLEIIGHMDAPKSDADFNFFGGPCPLRANGERFHLSWESPLVSQSTLKVTTQKLDHTG